MVAKRKSSRKAGRANVRKGRKTKGRTKSALKTGAVRAGRSTYRMSYEFLRKELMVTGLFIVAGGILWLASELRMINIDPVAAPFMMIALGFIVAVSSLRMR